MERIYHVAVKNMYLYRNPSPTSPTDIHTGKMRFLFNWWRMSRIRLGLHGGKKKYTTPLCLIIFIFIFIFLSLGDYIVFLSIVFYDTIL